MVDAVRAAMSMPPACQMSGRPRPVAALADGTRLALEVADGADRARLPALPALLARYGVDSGVLTTLAPTDLRPTTAPTTAPTSAPTGAAPHTHSDQEEQS